MPDFMLTIPILISFLVSLCPAVIVSALRLRSLRYNSGPSAGQVVVAAADPLALDMHSSTAYCSFQSAMSMSHSFSRTCFGISVRPQTWLAAFRLFSATRWMISGNSS